MTWDWLHQTTGPSLERQHQIVSTLAIIVCLYLLRQIAVSAALRHTEDPRGRYTWKKSLTYAAWLLAIMLIARIWLAGFQTLLTMLGLVSAALTIVLKDVLINLAGWVFIMLRKPFRVGSRVQIDRFSGDVVDIGLFQFALMEIKEQSTGRILHIPNGLVYVHTVATISDAFPFLWNEIPLTLTLDSDWEKARALLIQIVTREAESLQEQVHDCVMAATHEYMIHLGVTTPMVYLSVTADGVMLTMRYLCEPRNRRDSEMRMWEAVLRAFKGEENIHLRGTPSQVPVAPRLEPTVGVPEVSG